MQHHNPLAALDEVAEVLLACLIQVAGEVVHDHNVVLAAQVVLEGRGAVGDRQPGQVLVAVEERVERRFMVVPACDQQP